MITPDQVRAFDRDGAATIDTPVTEQALLSAVSFIDEALPFRDPEPGQEPRYRFGLNNLGLGQSILDLIQHPFFEDVARVVLRADEVEFWNLSVTKTYPNPSPEFSFFQHVDIQYRTSDLDAAPRRMICSYFFWLADVNKKTAPLMYRPGSHRQIADYREKDPKLRDTPIEVKGVFLQDLPDLGYADPIPACGRAGQVTVTTTSLVHGASTNIDTRPRYSAHILFVPKGFDVQQVQSKADSSLQFYAELRDRFRDDRKHIVKPPNGA